MITEDYVSFETAKLLKEKGFDAECHSHYYPCHYPDGSIKYEKDEGAQKGDKTWYNVYSLKNLPKDHYLAPTLQMVMKWLRKVYNIHFSIEPYTIFPENINCKVFYSVEIQQLVTDDGGTLYKGELEVKHYIDDIESYEQACESAIKYCLENLINNDKK